MQTYTLHQDTEFRLESESQEAVMTMGEKFLKESEEPTTFTVFDESEMAVAVFTNRVITGNFIRQFWGGRKNDNSIYYDDQDFDATNSVLSRNLEDIKALIDDAEARNSLAKENTDWPGPFDCEVVESLLAYFGVEDVGHISAAALDHARMRFVPMKVTEETLTLTIKVNVKVSDSQLSKEEQLANFVNDMEYHVFSNTAGIKVSSTEIVDS